MKDRVVFIKFDDFDKFMTAVSKVELGNKTIMEDSPNITLEYLSHIVGNNEYLIELLIHEDE